MSVFRIERLSKNDIQILGQTEYADKLPDPRKLVAWAEFPVSLISEVNLTIDISDTIPRSHARHANIKGWPSHPDKKEQKAQQKEIAVFLSNNHRLVMCDE
jgi:hypothetical protein